MSNKSNKSGAGVMIALTIIVLAVLTLVLVLVGKKGLNYVKNQNSRISALQTEAGDLGNELSSKLEEINKLTEQLLAAQNEINALQDAYGLESGKVADLTETVDDLSKKVGELQDTISELKKTTGKKDDTSKKDDSKEDDSKKDDSKKDDTSASEETTAKNNSKGVYKKLVKGKDINVLIVGDSIGEPMEDDSWAMLFKNWVQDTYKNKCSITNVSLSGNTSYAGYFRTMMLPDTDDYDLAFICYGQNDFAYGFAANYELIIRAIQAKYNNCVIIPILESSQREYTEKMNDIKSLAEYYELEVADVIDAYNSTIMFEYDELLADGIHPNTEGKKFYFQTVQKIVSKNVENNTVYKYKERPARDCVWKNYDKFDYYTLDDMNPITDLVYEITPDKPFSGFIGYYSDFPEGEGGFTIRDADGKTILEMPRKSYYGPFSLARLASSNWIKTGTIRISFENAEDVKAFHGIGYSR